MIRTSVQKIVSSEAMEEELHHIRNGGSVKGYMKRKGREGTIEWIGYNDNVER